jgi:hypothetical protein
MQHNAPPRCGGRPGFPFGDRKRCHRDGRHIAISRFHADCGKAVAYPLVTAHLFGVTEAAEIGSDAEKEFVIHSSLRDGRSTGPLENTRNSGPPARHRTISALATCRSTPRAVGIDQALLRNGTLSVERAVWEPVTLYRNPAAHDRELTRDWLFVGPGRACRADHTRACGWERRCLSARLQRSRSQRLLRSSPLPLQASGEAIAHQGRST